MLKDEIYKHLSEEEKVLIDEKVGFPNAAIDRIVPNQQSENMLDTYVEPYFEWIIEKPAVKGEIPTIDGVTYVNNLTPYIERKLFTVNTGHATTAYIGHFLGHETISEAMDDELVQEIVRGAITESGEVLIHKYQFDKHKHEKYIDRILERFMNPYISDEVVRVGREPIRKLGAKDRLVHPAQLYINLLNKKPVFLAKAIASVLQFEHKEDDEAVQLQTMIKQYGYEKTLVKVSELDPTNELVPIVIEALDELEQLKAEG